MRRFPATMDSLAKTITFVVIVMLVIPFITIFTQYRQLHQDVLLIGPAAVAVVLVIILLYHPKGYMLDAEGLHIERSVPAVTIPLRSIRSIMPITVKEFGFGLRTFGSGGFLGYFGMFWYRAYGHITFYATDRGKMMLITLADERKIVISPDDPAAFMSAFNDLMR